MTNKNATRPMTGHFKLPNGKIVAVDWEGGMGATIQVELSEIVNCDLEEFLDLLSERATGSSTALSNLTYNVTGHDGNTLTVRVEGSIADSDEIEEVNHAALPLRDFAVTVARIAYCPRFIRVQARTEQEACTIAEDDCGNHLYKEADASYLVTAEPGTPAG